MEINGKEVHDEMKKNESETREEKKESLIQNRNASYDSIVVWLVKQSMEMNITYAMLPTKTDTKNEIQKENETNQESNEFCVLITTVQ